ncbi:S-formylglutathione hydrolase [Agaribacter flavus]|uniref:S-formylglutathione hydrolase n=1 Tax=Agaribacter flavus TaxID=1902781 RepID=A0ABV7FWV0_9ALTE
MSDGLTLLSENKCFGGTQQRYSHYSKYLNSEAIFSVFMPPVSTPTVGVVLWLSGLTCNDQNFVTKAGAQRVAAELGLIIVCPDTSPRGEGVANDEAYDLGQGAGFYVDATERPWSDHFKMFSYINIELIDIIKERFSDGKKVAISGHSMGGHGALISALKATEHYISVSAFAPIVNPVACPWGQKALAAYLGENEEAWREYDACELLNMRSAAFTLPILIDQGASDEFLDTQCLTKPIESASNLGLIDIRYQNGYDHSYFFVSSFIEDHLRFHAEHLSAM